jgi:hypothetical protein
VREVVSLRSAPRSEWPAAAAAWRAALPTRPSLQLARAAAPPPQSVARRRPGEPRQHSKRELLRCRVRHMDMRATTLTSSDVRTRRSDTASFSSVLLSARSVSNSWAQQRSRHHGTPTIQPVTSRARARQAKIHTPTKHSHQTMDRWVNEQATQHMTYIDVGLNVLASLCQRCSHLGDLRPRNTQSDNAD